MPILLEDLNLRKAERLMCQQALSRAGSIVEAAHLLGITRHALKRRMTKHRIEPTSAATARDNLPRDHHPTVPEQAASETA